MSLPNGRTNKHSIEFLAKETEISELESYTMDYPEDEDEAYTEPNPREIIECMTNEAVTLIEEGDNPEVIIYNFLSDAFNIGFKKGQESQEQPY